MAPDTAHTRCLLLTQLRPGSKAFPYYLIGLVRDYILFILGNRQRDRRKRPGPGRGGPHMARGKHANFQFLLRFCF